MIVLPLAQQDVQSEGAWAQLTYSTTIVLTLRSIVVIIHTKSKMNRFASGVAEYMLTLVEPNLSLTSVLGLKTFKGLSRDQTPIKLTQNNFRPDKWVSD